MRTTAWLVMDAAATVLLASGGYALSSGTVALDLLGLVSVVLACGLWGGSAPMRLEGNRS